MVLSGQAFSQCTACSAAVVERYREEGHAFLMRVGAGTLWVVALCVASACTGRIMLFGCDSFPPMRLCSVELAAQGTTQPSAVPCCAMQGMADPSYLEDLTGLTELHKAGQTVRPR